MHGRDVLHRELADIDRHGDSDEQRCSDADIDGDAIPGGGGGDGHGHGYEDCRGDAERVNDGRGDAKRVNDGRGDAERVNDGCSDAERIADSSRRRRICHVDGDSLPPGSDAHSQRDHVAKGASVAGVYGNADADTRLEHASVRHDPAADNGVWQPHYGASGRGDRP